MEPLATPLTRRMVVGAAGAAALALAGCATDPTEPGTSTTDSGASDRVILGPVTDVPVGGGLIYDVVDVVVTQPTAGDFRAYTAVCPHVGCRVGEIDAAGILCRCHGSRFSLANGDVVSGPSSSGLREVQVRVEDGLLILG